MSVVYYQVRLGEAQQTIEVVEGELFIDLDSDNQLIGVEILPKATKIVMRCEIDPGTKKALRAFRRLANIVDDLQHDCGYREDVKDASRIIRFLANKIFKVKTE